MKALRILALAAMTAALSSAGVYTYNVSGTNDSSLAISATITFTTSANTLVIDVVNNIVNPTAVNQNISAIAFVLSTGQTSGSITDQSNNTARSVTGTGAGQYTDNTTFTSQWGSLSNSLLAGGITICVISGNSNSCSESATQAQQTIIGQPNGSNAYSNAQGSINGNGAHNPFLYGSTADPVKFTMTISGITASTAISQIKVNFGTSISDTFTCTSPTAGCQNDGGDVPEPSTMGLLGLGLVGVGALARRKR